jgi:hypothetical protein
MKEIQVGDVIVIAGRRYVLGSDVDIDKEAIYDSAGRRLDKEYIDEIVADMRRRRDSG